MQLFASKSNTTLKVLLVVVPNILVLTDLVPVLGPRLDAWLDAFLHSWQVMMSRF